MNINIARYAHGGQQQPINYNSLTSTRIQWNLCIVDTLGPTKGVLIFQVSLYDKAPFGTIARCPDYAGVHIFKCPD